MLTKSDFIAEPVDPPREIPVALLMEYMNHSGLAEALGVTRQTLYNWRDTSKTVPQDKIDAVFKLADDRHFDILKVLNKYFELHAA